MLDLVSYALVYLGATLMLYNVVCFARLMMFIKEREVHDDHDAILYVPVILLVLFFVGYLAVGVFGKPDLVVGGILFGGSLFVYVMYRLIDSITQRIIHSEHVEAQLMAAEESNRAKASFLASMSHEMRTPLNVILGIDAIALKNADLSAETRGQFEKIGRSARHLLGLIDDILEINSMDSGERVLRNAEFSLRETWEQLNVIAGVLCEKRGLAFETTLGEAADGRFVGDGVLLQQVLMNILDNAAKYTDAPGTVSLDINVEPAGADTCMARCTVADTGIGMSPDFLEQAFDAFSREDASSTSKQGGSGLGLASAKRKVDLMGGSVSVSSEKGRGTTFVVSVPLAPAPASDIAAAVPGEATGPASAGGGAVSAHSDASALGDGAASPASAGGGDSAAAPALGETAAPAPAGDSAHPPVTLEGARILIVEDVEVNAEIAADLLELEGAESEHAENGQVALDLFSASPDGYYDAVLMDLRMPVMDGLEATRRIRALERSDAKAVPIVALTANAFDSDAQDCLEAGMNEHLAKPVDAEKLYNVLKQLMLAARTRG